MVQKNLLNISLFIIWLMCGILLLVQYRQKPLTDAQKIMQQHLQHLKPTSQKVKSLTLAAYFDSGDTLSFSYRGEMNLNRITDESTVKLWLRLNPNDSVYHTTYFKDKQGLITEHNYDTPKTNIDSNKTKMWFSDWFDIWAEEQFLKLPSQYLGKDTLNGKDVEIVSIILPYRDNNRIKCYYDSKTKLRTRIEFELDNDQYIDYFDYQKIGDLYYPKKLLLEGEYPIIVSKVNIELKPLLSW